MVSQRNGVHAMANKPAAALTPFERAVLSKLLEGDHPALSVLREQARLATVAARHFSGAGFAVQLQLPDSAPAAPISTRKLHFGDVAATVPILQHGAGFVLFIDGGFLSKLEGYSYDEPWSGEPAEFELYYLHPSRDSVFRLLDELGTAGS
jgi:hypothetical protein